MSELEMSRHDHILAGLVFSLQSAAMQQLGKVQNPATGEVEIELEQARATIDVLEMLKVKCRTDTPEPLLGMLDSAVMDLQLNYMDEFKKSQQQSEPTSGAATEDSGANAEQAAEGDTEPGEEADV